MPRGNLMNRPRQLPVEPGAGCRGGQPGAGGRRRPGRPLAAGWAAAPPAGRGGRGELCGLARVAALQHPRRAPSTRGPRSAPLPLRSPEAAPGEAWKVQPRAQLGPVGVGEGRRRGREVAYLGSSWVGEGLGSGLGSDPGDGEGAVMSCSLTTQDGGSVKDGVGVGSRHQSCALTWSRREQGSNPGPSRGGGGWWGGR